MPYNQSTTVTNFGTYTITIPITNVYNFQATLELPNIVPSATPGAGGGAGTGTGGGPQVNSQVVVTVKQNGTTIFTTSPGDKGFQLNGVSCTTGDTMTFVRTSALLQDEQYNAIKMTIITSGAV